MPECDVIIGMTNCLAANSANAIVRHGLGLHFLQTSGRRWSHWVLCETLSMECRIVKKKQRIQLVLHEWRKTHGLLAVVYYRAADWAFCPAPNKNGHVITSKTWLAFRVRADAN